MPQRRGCDGIYEHLPESRRIRCGGKLHDVLGSGGSAD
jgi:hypothetical protein